MALSELAISRPVEVSRGGFYVCACAHARGMRDYCTERPDVVRLRGDVVIGVIARATCAARGAFCVMRGGFARPAGCRLVFLRGEFSDRTGRNYALRGKAMYCRTELWLVCGLLEGNYDPDKWGEVFLKCGVHTHLYSYL